MKQNKENPEETEEKTRELERKTEELEKSRKALMSLLEGAEESRKALMNILEDVEAERRKAEEERDKTLAIITHFADGLLVFDEENKPSYAMILEKI